MTPLKIPGQILGKILCAVQVLNCPYVVLQICKPSFLVYLSLLFIIEFFSFVQQKKKLRIYLTTNFYVPRPETEVSSITCYDR